MSNPRCKVCEKEMLDSQDCIPMDGLEDKTDYTWWIHKLCDDKYPYNCLTSIVSCQTNESLIGTKVYNRHSLVGLTSILLLGEIPSQENVKEKINEI